MTARKQADKGASIQGIKLAKKQKGKGASKLAGSVARMELTRKKQGREAGREGNKQTFKQEERRADKLASWQANKEEK